MNDHTYVHTEYGEMLINIHDTGQTPAILKTGQSPTHNDIMFLCSLMKNITNPVIFDIGSHFGCYSLALAKMYPNAEIHAFEGQKMIAYYLSGSVAMNQYHNLTVNNLAMGNSVGQLSIPRLDYASNGSFGSVGYKQDYSDVGQKPISHDVIVPMSTITTYCINNEINKVDLMKIDVEGMELDVLEGGEEFIRKSKPMLYIEWLKSDQTKMRELLESWGYKTWIHAIDMLAIPDDIHKDIRCMLDTTGFGF